MPLKKCKSKGKAGTKFGKKGKCYTGAGGKKKAVRQSRAIHASLDEKNKK